MKLPRRKGTVKARLRDPLFPVKDAISRLHFAPLTCEIFESVSAGKAVALLREQEQGHVQPFWKGGLGQTLYIDTSTKWPLFGSFDTTDYNRNEGEDLQQARFSLNGSERWCDYLSLAVANGIYAQCALFCVETKFAILHL